MKCWDNYETAGPSQSASQSHLGPISLTRLALDAANLLPLCKRVLAPRAFIQNCHQNLQMNGTQNCKFLTRALLRFDLLHNLGLDTTSFGINNILGFREPETHWGECVLKWGLQLRRGSRSVLGPRNKCNLNWKKNSDNVSGGLLVLHPSYQYLLFDLRLKSAQISENYILIVNRKYFAISFLPHHV